MVKRSWRVLLAVVLLLLPLAGGCSTIKTTGRPLAVVESQKILPVYPFANLLVPDTFAKTVFNDFVDILNENSAQTSFSWFAIVKDDLRETERILPPEHIYLAGEVWSYLENSGCCSTELRVKSRLRIFRVGSPEVLWETEIPLSGFFEHDASTLDLERDKLAARLATVMAQELLNALKSFHRIQVE
jgi:hypothetical protein